MLPKDKDLMDIHLDAIHEAIRSLNNDNEQKFDWRLNCNLIDLREKIRKHAAGESDEEH